MLNVLFIFYKARDYFPRTLYFNSQGIEDFLFSLHKIIVHCNNYENLGEQEKP